MESHEMIPTDMKKKGKHNDLDAQFDEVDDFNCLALVSQKMKNSLHANVSSVERNILLSEHMLGII